MASDRKIIWTDESCAGCGRAPYVRRDGREYLYRYRPDGQPVCSPRCDQLALSPTTPA